MRHLGLFACALAGGCVAASEPPGGAPPAVQVGPQDYVRLDQGANGNVSCDQGTIYLPPGASINGELDATDCSLKIEGIINGKITASGGLLHVFEVVTINGSIAVRDADEVIVLGSQVNGGADVEQTRTVTVTDSSFNATGTFLGNGAVDLENTFFNGSLEISGSASCKESGNRTNGTLDVSGCQ